MDVYEAILARRTVRDFQEKEIAPDIVKKMIATGLQAPSNNHLREWEFVIVNDKTARLEIIAKINQTRTENDANNIIDWWGLSDPYQREMYIDAIPKQYRMLLNAGCLIIPCFRQQSPLLKPANLSALNPFASIWCSIENILLAAVNEGIYGVTRIPADEEVKHIKEALNIPEDYTIPCYIALGYPSESAAEIPQHLIKPEDRMHFNKW